MSARNYQQKKDATRQYAIERMDALLCQNPSYGELANFQADIEKRARQCGLVREFRENGIL